METVFIPLRAIQFQKISNMVLEHSNVISKFVFETKATVIRSESMIGHIIIMAVGWWFCFSFLQFFISTFRVGASSFLLAHIWYFSWAQLYSQYYYYYHYDSKCTYAIWYSWCSVVVEIHIYHIILMPFHRSRFSFWRLFHINWLRYLDCLHKKTHFAAFNVKSFLVLRTDCLCSNPRYGAIDRKLVSTCTRTWYFPLSKRNGVCMSCLVEWKSSQSQFWPAQMTAVVIILSK